mmetsp:Transcript_59411/g.176419  ORF Transcript_59411/g.176419 Transcript_59411/m.176419 type:complete len:336 (-) Transcript_59411:245-1252(-)
MLAHGGWPSSIWHMQQPNAHTSVGVPIPSNCSGSNASGDMKLGVPRMQLGMWREREPSSRAEMPKSATTTEPTSFTSKLDGLRSWMTMCTAASSAIARAICADASSMRGSGRPAGLASISSSSVPAYSFITMPSRDARSMVPYSTQTERQPLVAAIMISSSFSSILRCSCSVISGSILTATHSSPIGRRSFALRTTPHAPRPSTWSVIATASSSRCARDAMRPSMSCRISRSGTSRRCARGEPVNGEQISRPEASICCSRATSALRSYVLPSAAHIGSSISRRVRGHSRTSDSCRMSNGAPPAGRLSLSDAWIACCIAASSPSPACSDTDAASAV